MQVVAENGTESRSKIGGFLYNLFILALFILVDAGVLLGAVRSETGFWKTLGQKKLGMLVGMNLAALVLLLGGSRLKEKIGGSRPIKILNWISAVICPALTFGVVQLLIGVDTFEVEVPYILRNLILYYALYLTLTMLVGQIRIAISVYSILLALLAMVDYFVVMFRGNAFVLMDILSIRTAASVSDNYSFEIPVFSGIWLLGLLLFVLYQGKFQTLRTARRSIKAYCMRGVVALVVVIGLYAGQSFLDGEDLYLWNLSEDYAQKGYLYVLACETGYMSADVPEGYSKARVQEIVDSVEAPEENTAQIRPTNLIMIMDEALSDPERFDNLQASEEILPFIHSLTENTKKGYVHVPSFGGGTSDTEYEVLTGNTKEFMPMGSNAYMMYCKDPEYGMASILGEEGYGTIAVHPFRSSGWNRTQVYQEMNFDNFLSLSNWGEDPAKIRYYVSDQTAFDKLIQLYEEKDQNNLFLFCVTMQNHGGYDAENAGDFEADVTLSYEEEYPQAEMYLSLIKRTDQAFEQFIGYFQEVEEPTMIVLYGDHWPSLENGFYSQLFGKDFSTIDDMERQTCHSTPYVIWTNYPSESDEEDMSANYFGCYILEQAGIAQTGYGNFLLSLKEKLPIIGKDFVCDAQGNWYFMDDLPEEYEELINQYKILQYNNVFDRRNRVEEFFSAQAE